MAKMKGASLDQAMPAPAKAETDYDTQNALDTLHRGADIIADPAKLKKVHKMAGRRHKALMGMIEPALKAPKMKGPKSIDDLKAMRDQANKSSSDADEDDSM